MRLAREIADTAPEVCVTLAGKTDLRQLAAVLKRADLVVSADSGPLHIADAVGTETIALFGPTRPEVTGPRGQGRAHILQKDTLCNRAPCYNSRCPDNMCMHSIRVNEVIQTIAKIGH